MKHYRVSFDSIKEELNAVLKERDSMYPHREKDNTEKMQQAVNRLAGYLEERRQTLAWLPDSRQVDQCRTMAEEAIFVCGPMKSGTTLFLELLDGHTELNVLPGDSWLWTRFSDKAKQEKFSAAAWRRHWLQRFINPTGQQPFWILGESEQEYLDLLNYMDFWLADLPDNDRRDVLATAFSYYCANPLRSQDAVKWVEKTPGNELHVASLAEHFPRIRFVHIVRDPRENFASIKRLYRSRNWKWDACGTARSLAESYEAAAANLAKFGPKRYFVLRYEDLTGATEATMRKIAAFLDLDWEETLLRPTVNSRLAQANTMYKERQAVGVVRRSVNDKWRQELSSFEQGVIHQTRGQAGKIGCTWSMSILDHCKRFLFGWSSRQG